MSIEMALKKYNRHNFAQYVFGTPLADLSDAEMQVIYRAIPMNVSEIEQKDIRREPFQ